MGVSLTATFRNFRINKVGIAANVKKYYNSIMLHPESYPINRIIFFEKVIWEIDMIGQPSSDNIPIEVTTGKRAPLCDNTPKEIIMDEKYPHPNEAHKDQHSMIPPMKIWDVNWGTSATPEFVSKIFVHDTTQLLRKTKCTGIEHEVHKLLQKKYVDDMLTSAK